MIRSQHNTFGFWLLTIMAAFFLFLVFSAIVQYCFGITMMKIQIRSTKEFWAQVILGCVAVLVMLAFLWDNTNSIEIDTLHRTITFRHLITRQIKSYTFEEVDGYADTVVKHRNFTPYKTLLLVKDNAVVLRMDSFYYSNVDELQNGMKDLKYLGFVKTPLL